MNNIKCIYAQVSNILQAKGFHEYELYASEAESFSVSVSKGDIERYSVNQKFGLNLRVKEGNKIGYASTTVTDEASLRALCDGAASSLALITSEEKGFLYDGKGSYPVLNTYNPAIDTVSAEEKCELARTLERMTLQKDPRIKRVHSCRISSGNETVTICNSNGLSVSRRENYMAAVVIPIADIDGVMNTFTGYCFTREKLTEQQLQKAADEAVAGAIALCGAKPMPSGTCPVIFRAEAFKDLLSTFAEIFYAENGQKKLSLFHKETIGEAVASPCFTLSDKPLDGTIPFDDEGVPCQNTVLLNKGVLTALLYNLKSAHADGVISTGNGSKASYASPVKTSAFRLTVENGICSLDSLMAQAGEGLLVEDLAGLHSGASAETGDFSLSAKGYRFENGTIRRSVGNVTVSGNFYTLLKHIRGVADDAEETPFGVVTPSVWVEKLAVGGE